MASVTDHPEHRNVPHKNDVPVVIAQAIEMFDDVFAEAVEKLGKS